MQKKKKKKMKQPNCIAVSTFPGRYAQHFIHSPVTLCGNVLQVCFGDNRVLPFLMWLLGYRPALCSCFSI